MFTRSTIRALAGAVMISTLAGATAARAAGFDCKAAANRIEHMICDDPDLSSFDSQLQGAYAGALDRSTHPARVTDDQRAWLKARDACGDVKCLSAAYGRRLAALAQVSDEPATCGGATTPEVDACQADYARRADRELARYLAAARKRLADDARQDTDPQKSKTTRAALDASQKAWEAFRKAECEAVYDQWSDGTIRGAMYQGCMQSLTKARTTQVLETWLSFMDSTPPLMPKPAGK